MLEKLLRTASKLTLTDYVSDNRFQTQPLHVLHVWCVLYRLLQYINAQPYCFFRGIGEGYVRAKMFCPNTNPPQTSRSLFRASMLDYFSFCYYYYYYYYFLLYSMSKLPSIGQCRQKGDKRRYTSPLRRHSWACMVSFPR